MSFYTWDSFTLDWNSFPPKYDKKKKKERGYDGHYSRFTYCRVY